jgi:hypothetical protein
MSIVSSNVARLDSLATAMNNSLALLQDAEDKQWPVAPTIEPWSMRSNAMLSKIIKTSIHGVGTEVQFLPREQARMAARITHHLYKVSRTYEDATKSLDAMKDQQKEISRLMSSNEPEDKRKFAVITAKAEAAVKSIDAYNQIARFMNKLGSEETMSTADMDAANAMLKNMDASNQTFDEIGQDGSSTTGYSPIFKTLNDLKTYRAYMKSQGAAIGLFQLPEVTKDTPRKEMEVAMMQLFRCNQLTHACYMGDASEAMRNLWVKHAHETNANLPADKKIPEGAIAAVNHTLTPAELGGSRDRSL